VDAIRGNESIGARERSIAEKERYTLRVLIDRDQLFVDMEYLRRQHSQEGGVKVAAMHNHVRRTKSAFDLRHVVFGSENASIVIAAPLRLRLERTLLKLFLETEHAQHFHRIGRDLDTGANSEKPLCLFVDLHLNSNAAKGCGRREAAHSGSEDCDG
jgi:hypothetical protein